MVLIVRMMYEVLQGIRKGFIGSPFTDVNTEKLPGNSDSWWGHAEVVCQLSEALPIT